MGGPLGLLRLLLLLLLGLVGLIPGVGRRVWDVFIGTMTKIDSRKQKRKQEQEQKRIDK